MSDYAESLKVNSFFGVSVSHHYVIKIESSNISCLNGLSSKGSTDTDRGGPIRGWWHSLEYYLFPKMSEKHSDDGAALDPFLEV